MRSLVAICAAIFTICVASPLARNGGGGPSSIDPSTEFMGDSSQTVSVQKGKSNSVDVSNIVLSDAGSNGLQIAGSQNGNMSPGGRPQANVNPNTQGNPGGNNPVNTYPADNNLGPGPLAVAGRSGEVGYGETCNIYTITGTCMTTVECVGGGNVWAVGFCPGDESIRCCIPRPCGGKVPGYDQPCVGDGGANNAAGGKPVQDKNNAPPSQDSKPSAPPTNPDSGGVQTYDDPPPKTGEKTDPKKPDPKKSDPKKPDTKKPDVKKPDAKKPDAKKSDAKKSAPLSDKNFAKGGCAAVSINCAEQAMAQFPGSVHTVYCTGGGGDHADGHAVDLMQNKVRGQVGTDAADWLMKNSKVLNIKYIIWSQHIWNAEWEEPKPFKEWRSMEDRGDDTQNHYDHIHVSLRGGAGAP